MHSFDKHMGVDTYTINTDNGFVAINIIISNLTGLYPSVTVGCSALTDYWLLLLFGSVGVYVA